MSVEVNRHGKSRLCCDELGCTRKSEPLGGYGYLGGVVGEDWVRWNRSFHGWGQRRDQYRLGTPIIDVCEMHGGREKPLASELAPDGRPPLWLYRLAVLPNVAPASSQALPAAPPRPSHPSPPSRLSSMPLSGRYDADVGAALLWA